MRMMATEDDVTGPVNLGNPAEMTIRELAEEILELTGSSSEIVSTPAVQDDPRQRKPDISRAAELLDWQPAVPRTEGLKKTIAYFREAIADAATPGVPQV